MEVVRSDAEAAAAGVPGSPQSSATPMMFAVLGLCKHRESTRWGKGQQGVDVRAHAVALEHTKADQCSRAAALWAQCWWAVRTRGVQLVMAAALFGGTAGPKWCGRPPVTDLQPARAIFVQGK